MKTVGKQLEEARLAKNWTPELAARETKIKVDRLRDLEGDDYTQFSSPTYARGFVRTYAKALGLDEYKILRQLDNKLPEDDNASFVTESGVPYIPEPSKPAEISSGSKTGLYVVLSLGFGVAMVIAFVLFEAYRSGELKTIVAEVSTPEAPVATNSAPVSSTNESTARALPADPNAPVPAAVEPTPVPTPPRALPVDPNALVADTNGASSTPPAPVSTNTESAQAPAATPPRALPVDPSELTNAAPLVAVGNNPSNTNTAPRALPVDPSELTGGTPPAAPTPAPAPSNPAPNLSPMSSKAPTTAHDAAALAAASNVKPTPAPVVADTNGAPLNPAAPNTPKRLVLTASRDSFVRITAIDAPDVERVLYAQVLRAGQSVGFDAKKFSINVGIPSAVDVTLDGVNYGPHSDQDAPETFIVESHLP